MKALLCDGPAAGGTLRVADVDAGDLAPGHARIAVTAAALNFADVLMRQGRYQEKPEPPFSPGAEIAGRIVALPGDGDGGAAVEAAGLRVGDRVCAYLGWGGARALVDVPLDRLARVPDAVADAAAAGLSVTYGTAMHAFLDRSQLAAGETVVVTGASGGAGLAAVEVAVLLGATVVAVASTQAKLAVALEHGASLGLLSTSEDLKDQLKALDAGGGPHVIYDCVGSDLFTPCMRSLRWGGRYLVIGFAGGEVPQAPLNHVLVKSIDIVGVHWSRFAATWPSAQAAHAARVLAWMADGRLTSHIDSVYGFDEAEAAFARIKERKAVGKVLLAPEPELVQPGAPM